MGEWGSPPLVRERHDNASPRPTVMRITPARAGKTTMSFCHVSSSEDHPRSCGKDIYWNVVRMLILGSPPLVRERHIKLISSTVGTRITPARAGKTVNPVQPFLAA